jgi:ABC-type dipeptide/oligopeptide/nickel transport system ATPase component
VLPDVEKAKREDLQKLQKSPFTTEPTLTSSPTQENKQQTSIPGKSPAVEKKPEGPRKTEVVYKTAGATSNNRIVERNQKNAKEKDCEIY